MGLKVFFIRHAESRNNFLKILHRETYERYREVDPTLTSVGEDQARKLSQHIKKN